jgi:hypothetical protein
MFELLQKHNGIRARVNVLAGGGYACDFMCRSAARLLASTPRLMLLLLLLLLLVRGHAGFHCSFSEGFFGGEGVACSDTS